MEKDSNSTAQGPDFGVMFEEAVASLRLPADEEMSDMPRRDEVLVPAAVQMAREALGRGADPETLRGWMDSALYNEGLTAEQEEQVKLSLPSLFADAPGETVGRATVNVFFGTGEHPELSNFAIRPFTYAIGGPVQFRSVEQAFQYAKTYFSARSRSDDVTDIRKAILATTDGAELRRLGHSIPDFNSGKWDASSEMVMKTLIAASFAANEGAARALLSTGGATITHTQERGRWGEAFPRLLMEVRDEMARDIREAASLAGRGGSDDAEEQKQPGSPHVSVEDTERFNVLTVGAGKLTLDELSALIPDDIDVVVDIRPYGAASRDNPLSAANLRKAFRTMGPKTGIEYVAMKALSGRTRDTRLMIGGDSRNVRYGELVRQDEAAAALDRIEAMVKEGRRVLLLGADAVPYKGPRALMVGQALEAGRNISVGHISRKRNGGVYVQTQEQAVQKAIGKQYFVKGDYTQLTFNGDGSFTHGRGVVLGTRALEASAKERLIAGDWNYGRAVTFTEDPHYAGKKDSVAAGIAYDSARTAAVSGADFTILMSTGSNERALKVVRDQLPSPACLDLALPSHAEDLENPELIDRWAERIRRQLARELTYQYSHRGADAFNPDNVRVFVDGSSLSRICNLFVESTIPEDGGNPAVKDGFHVEDISGYDQEKLDTFLAQVLDRAFRSGNSIEFDDDTKPFRVGTVVTIGQTGVAEAATTAAQKLGLDAEVVCPKNYWLNHDNETLRGIDFPDEAAFKNRWHMGLENAVTDGQLIADIERRDFLRLQREDGFGRGLSDRQILALRLAGFPNYDISTMVELSNRTMATDSGELLGMNINTPSDLVDFIDRCSAEYGIETSGAVDEPFIAAKLEEAARLTGELKAMGVSFITENSPEYPVNLRQMKPYEVTQYRTVTTTDEDGAEHVENVPYQEKKCRPAILFYKGSLDLLNNPLVSLRGDFSSYPEAIAAGRMLANGLNADDISAVASLDEAAPRTSLIEQMEHHGHPVAVTSHPLGTPDGEGLREARRTGISDRDQESIAPETDNQQLSDDIAHNSGLVLSENAKGVPVAPESPSRAKKITTALGHTLVALDQAFHAKPMAYSVMAAYAAYGGFMMVYETAHLMKQLWKATGKDDGKTLGPVSATAEDLEKVRDEAFNNWSVDNQINIREDERQVEDESLGVSYDEGDVYKEPRTSEVKVMRFRNQTVFLVSERNAQAREAVRAVYGQDALFADPKDARRLEERFNGGLVEVEGHYVDIERGYAGTQPLRPECRISSMWCVDGKLYSIDNAPNGTVGLLSLSSRRQNRETFRILKEGAEQIRRDFQSEIGVEPGTPMRFENADYIVIKGDVIEVRRGDAVRATIAMQPNGALRLFNHPYLGDDLEEHRGQTPNVFTRGGGIAPEDATRILDELRKAVFERSQVEMDSWAVADREQVGEMNEQIEKGFRKWREPNIEVAIRDLGAAVTDGILPSSDARRVDPATACGLIDKNIRSLARVVRNLDKTIVHESKALEALPDTPENAEAREDALNRLDDLRGNRLHRLARVKQLERCRGDIARQGEDAPGLPVAETSSGALVLFLGGGATRLVLQETELKESEAESARKAFAKAASIDGRTAYETEGRAEAEDAVKESRAEEENRRAARESRATPDEIRGECSHDVFVVEREGMQYYADRGLNIISGPYPQLSPMGETFGVARNEGGQMMLISPAGEPVFAEWFDKIAKPQEGACLIKKGDNYNLLDIRKGVLLSDEWAPVCGNMHDGLALIAARPGDGETARGKYNYIGRDGRLLCSRWLDAGTPFRNGLAVVTVDNRIVTMNKFGEAVSLSDPISEGWAVVAGRDIDGPEAKGKYNYINSQGQTLCGKWLDAAAPFKDGLAEITLGGVGITIDSQGRKAERQAKAHTLRPGGRDDG